MPFDGNKWNFKKMVPYQEMLNTIKEKYPCLHRISDQPNDTSKVGFQLCIACTFFNMKKQYFGFVNVYLYTLTDHVLYMCSLILSPIFMYKICCDCILYKLLVAG